MPTRRHTAENGGSTARVLAIEAISRGATLREAAKQAGAGERTVQTWVTQPSFRAEVAALQSERRKAAEDFLQAEIANSLAVLRELRDDPETEGTTRLRAATELLDRAGLTKVDRSEVHVTQTQDVSDDDIDKELQRVALKLGGGE
jgi:transposase